MTKPKTTSFIAARLLPIEGKTSESESVISRKTSGNSTMNIAPNEVKAKITPKTKAILPVHFAGRLCDMDALCRIADNHNLKIIEDCAHAIETEYHATS